MLFMKADMKFEVVVIPVTDVDRAKRFYTALAAHEEHGRPTTQQEIDWADWYADYIHAEQAGKSLPP
jgi:catechol 2,3-dioxygenase-like lactoylglutathione lyase family enzyme